MIEMVGGPRDLPGTEGHGLSLNGALVHLKKSMGIYGNPSSPLWHREHALRFQQTLLFPPFTVSKSAERTTLPCMLFKDE